MKLNAAELLAIPGLLPQSGTIQDQIACRGVREKLILTDDERKAIEFSSSVHDGKVAITYVVSKARALVRDVVFADNELALLKGRVTEMDTKKQITAELLDVSLKLRDATKE
jgi:hypothetical protein